MNRECLNQFRLRHSAHGVVGGWWRPNTKYVRDLAVQVIGGKARQANVSSPSSLEQFARVDVSAREEEEEIEIERERDTVTCRVTVSDRHRRSRWARRIW